MYPLGLTTIVLLLNSAQVLCLYHLLGNELSAATYFYNATTEIFNITDYLSDYNTCMTSQCQYSAKTWHRDFRASRLWRREFVTDNFGGRSAVVDCNYTILQYWRLGQFIIDGTGCRNNVTAFRGGATFEAVALVDDAIWGCTVNDNFNSTYHVICRHPGSGEMQHSSPLCFHLTIVLYYEHFDGYGEILADWCEKKTEKKYYPSRHIIADNTTFCFPVERSGTDHLMGVDDLVPRQVTWLGGAWVRRNRTLDPGTKFLFSQAAAFNREVYNTSSIEEKLATNKMPKLGGARADYSFVPYVSNSAASSLSATGTSKTHPDNLTQYYFIGASHMRFNFDALVAERIFSPKVLERLENHHKGVHLDNFHFEFITHSYHIVSYLRALCAKSQSDNLDLVLVIQTGSWDLASNSLIHFLDDPNNGAQLLRTMEEILSGSRPCGLFRKLVWMTPPAHPVCFDDNFKPCNECRGYRTNPAIAASIRYLLKGFSRTNISSTEVIVIDAFSVTKPRLFFDEESEVVCATHFTCRGPWRGVETLTYTPSGIAVLQLMARALGPPFSSSAFIA